MTQELFFGATGGARLFRVTAGSEGCIGWLEGRWKGRLYPFPPAGGDTDELAITNAQRSYWLHGLYDGQHSALQLLNHTDTTVIFQPTTTNWQRPWRTVIVTLLNPTNAAIALYEGDQAKGQLGFLHPQVP